MRIKDIEIGENTATKSAAIMGLSVNMHAGMAGDDLCPAIPARQIVTLHLHTGTSGQRAIVIVDMSHQQLAQLADDMMAASAEIGHHIAQELALRVEPAENPLD